MYDMIYIYTIYKIYIYMYLYISVHITHLGVAKGDETQERSRRAMAGTLGVFYLGVAKGDEVQEQGHGAELGGALADGEGMLLQLHHVIS